MSMNSARVLVANELQQTQPVPLPPRALARGGEGSGVGGDASSEQITVPTPTAFASRRPANLPTNRGGGGPAADRKLGANKTPCPPAAFAWRRQSTLPTNGWEGDSLHFNAHDDGSTRARDLQLTPHPARCARHPPRSGEGWRGRELRAECSSRSRNNVRPVTCIGPTAAKNFVPFWPGRAACIRDRCSIRCRRASPRIWDSRSACSPARRRR